jgi:dimeric dUTPase (all-alpha-NTP-PPase superfamily)
MNIEKLVQAQAELDDYVSKNLGINIHEQEYVDKRVFALKVELAELANEVAFFKYWKQSHIVDRQATIEEWADVCHFFLSVGNSRNYTTFVKELNYSQWHKVPMEYLFQYIMKSGIDSSGQWKSNFEQLFQIGIQLGFSLEELEKAYYEKREKNIARQQNNY